MLAARLNAITYAGFGENELRPERITFGLSSEVADCYVENV